MVSSTYAIHVKLNRPKNPYPLLTSKRSILYKCS